MTALKSKFTVGKGGDTAFKVLADGSFFNAYTSVTDTLKNITEAINMSGANGRPSTTGNNSSKRGGTAGTEKSKEVNEEEKDNQLIKSAFKIGVNCDGDSSFNKDPKDPNKYEIEGVKGQSTKDQLAEYYVKLAQDNPLLTYIEDVCADGEKKNL